MRHAHGGICRVHGLSAGAGAHEDVDLEVLGIDLDLVVVLVRFREHEHARRGRLDAPLRFGHGDALHAVHTAFVFERRPHAVFRCGRAFGADRELYVFDATELGRVLALHSHAPPALFGVARVHAQQVAGEQRGLFAASAGLDLHDHVARIVRVARDQRRAQAFLRGGQLVFQPFRLGGEVGVVRGHLSCGLQVVRQRAVLPVGGHDAGELCVAAPEFAHGVWVRRGLGLCHLLFDVAVLLKRGECGGELFVCHMVLCAFSLCAVRIGLMPAFVMRVRGAFITKLLHPIQVGSLCGLHRLHRWRKEVGPQGLEPWTGGL